MDSKRSRPPAPSSRRVPDDAPAQSSLAAVVAALAQEIDPDAFVRAVQPQIEKCNVRALHEFLKQRWTGQQIIGLVKGPHEDARKVAALCLSLVGCAKCVPAITELLRDADPCVNELAEHALWSIWFRLGSEQANDQLARGAQALSDRDFESAIQHFDRAIELSPEFAEPYNQRALAHYMQEQFDESLADCRRAVDRMPCHFGAWAGMGHSSAHLGQFDRAAEAYDRALSINPHMHPIRQALCELRARSGDDSSEISGLDD